MTVQPYKAPGSQLFTNAGAVLDGGLLYFYEAGTTTAKETYPTQADAEAQTNPNSQPVTLDSAGRLINGTANEVWLNGSYKVVGKTSAGVTLWTVDDYPSSDTAVALDPGFRYGLTLTLDTGDTSHDVNVTAGQTRDGADTEDMVLTAEITKRLDATWAVGDDNGGLDTGSIAASTIYYLYLIKRTDTGVVDLLFSTQAVTPTMPASYDKKKRIGVALTSSGSLLLFVADEGKLYPLTGTDTYAVTVDAAVTALAAGMGWWFWPQNTNTTAITINPNTLGAKAGKQRTGGTIGALVANHIKANVPFFAWYDGTQFLISDLPYYGVVGTFTATQNMSGAAFNFAAETDVASATTPDIGAVASNNVRITGAVTPITGLGTAAAGIVRWCRFQNAAVVLTHNATSLIMPGAASITSQANDCFEAESLGSGNWLIRRYQRADGTAVAWADEGTVTAASTTDLGTSTRHVQSITGNTGITAFGSTAPTNAVRLIRFTGTPAITHNATSLILPGGASITAAAGDCAIVKHEGSGNWRVLSYTPAAQKPAVMSALSTVMSATATAAAQRTALGSTTVGDAVFVAADANTAVAALAATKTLVAAYRSAATTNNTGDGTVYTVTWDTETTDRASDFASNTFTCRKTGLHRVTGVVEADSAGASHTSFEFKLAATGQDYSFYYRDVVATNPNQSMSSPLSMVIQMTAADTFTVTVAVGGSTKTVGIAGTKRYSNLCVEYIG